MTDDAGADVTADAEPTGDMLSGGMFVRHAQHYGGPTSRKYALPPADTGLAAVDPGPLDDGVLTTLKRALEADGGHADPDDSPARKAYERLRAATHGTEARVPDAELDALQAAVARQSERTVDGIEYVAPVVADAGDALQVAVDSLADRCPVGEPTPAAVPDGASDATRDATGADEPTPTQRETQPSRPQADD
jgi:hypothetical protein